jgi:hypothetical protein
LKKLIIAKNNNILRYSGWWVSWQMMLTLVSSQICLNFCFVTFVSSLIINCLELHCEYSSRVYFYIDLGLPVTFHINPLQRLFIIMCPLYIITGYYSCMLTRHFHIRRYFCTFVLLSFTICPPSKKLLIHRMVMNSCK